MTNIGYRDIIAIPDLTTFRRIPWEDNIPFFLLSFYEPNTREPLAVCPRGLLKRVTDELATFGWEAMCGAEFEFFNFKGTFFYSFFLWCCCWLTGVRGRLFLPRIRNHEKMTSDEDRGSDENKRAWE
jgi:hypothetical protein